MTAKQLRSDNGFDFTKKSKVSVWVSNHPYADIPDDYFEESFSKKNTRATNQWSKNYLMRFFRPELMETNGSHSGTVTVKRAAGECSFSKSFIQPLLSKANKNKISEITWIILLFEYEYSGKLSGVMRDEYTQFIGAFSYEDDADSLFDIEE
ncbi:hypothetical protein FLL45_04665 [Aliikangiella marina]|uniref:Uncharacterized protein n=1 Tax=Aliikangiella marina TaxID=1712262 RepID=A0A545TJ61_9GAMM|nr:immunity 22 family protein [Aliikangiella marina]TQV77243.1 hypothetical protein FLL45_04665 [Aliikangiella marina]